MGIVLQAMPGNLHACLSQAKAEIADYVVNDTPPHADGTIDAAIRAADLVIIPIRSGPFDIKAAHRTVQIILNAPLGKSVEVSE